MKKCFAHYAAQTLDVVDSDGGEIRQARDFVATLDTSNYTLLDVTRGQKSEDFLSSHLRTARFFGGVSRIFVIDNLKSGVTEPDCTSRRSTGRRRI